MKAAFETDERIFLVMPFIRGGEMFSHLDEQLSAEGHGFPEDTAKWFIAQLILAIGALHKEGIIHRDLKTENILLFPDGYIQLIDYGVAKRNHKKGEITQTRCGTEVYMAPEMIKRGNEHSFPCDWWAIGLLTFELIMGDAPFETEKEICENNIEKLFPDKEFARQKMSANCRNFIKLMCAKNPA
jgi:serine/threonine protein kinase